jgi:hypothetical protein
MLFAFVNLDRCDALQISNYYFSEILELTNFACKSKSLLIYVIKKFIFM